MLARLAKNAASIVGDLFTARYFYDPRKANRYRGVYATYEAAEAALPKGKLHGFQDPSVPEYFEKKLLGFNSSDYPVLFWLRRMLRPGGAVFDFGGGLGQCFYSYRELMALPPDTIWIVCDVDSLLERGRKLALERKVENLFFTADREKANGASFFLTNGTVQYIPENLWEILGKLEKLPAHLVINRVPIYDGKPYYTIQSTAHSFLPYRVFNMQEYSEKLEKLGYELVGQWSLPRSLHVQFHPGLFVPNYRGLYFHLKEG